MESTSSSLIENTVQFIISQNSRQQWLSVFIKSTNVNHWLDLLNLQRQAVKTCKLLPNHTASLLHAAQEYLRWKGDACKCVLQLFETCDAALSC